jgi:hypothetical protein
LCFSTTQKLLPMNHLPDNTGNSQYKVTHNFLTKSYQQRFGIVPQGQSLHRINILCGMLSSCIETKSSSIEGLSNYSIVRHREDDEVSVKTNSQSGDIDQFEPRFLESDKDIETRKAQTKRWLSSKWTDWETFYAPYIYVMLNQITSKGELVLTIDGSETAGDCVTLMLSVIWRGYAIPLIWLTREMKKGHFPEQLHCDLIESAQKFLQTLSTPCRKVLLGDGEFDGANLRKMCKTFKWEFVLRTARDRQIDCGCGETARIDKLCHVNGPNEDVVFVEDACEGDNAILWHNSKYDDPIPLLTNMDLGEMACVYYKKRFKIELLFKQMKSAGFNVHKSKIQGAHRVSNLIIVVALSFLITFCVGLSLIAQPAEVLKKFIRPDKIDTFLPSTVALKCFKHKFSLFINFFSLISKNFFDFFNLFCFKNVYG